ncbi:MAG TPA: hypothetical protein VK179_15505 [Bacteroidales bacterium]|nr:hypothetical protein [Bacteroidales bacterium]
MPANLNALIRYKTINSCLFGGKRRWSIDELIEKCSDALAECRGRYERISERTVRDDIRVMRSDILGYNAPILQKNGLYFYSDPAYSIMSVTITDSSLVMKIIKLLNDVKRDVNHPEMEIVLQRLNALMAGLPESPRRHARRPASKDTEKSLKVEDMAVKEPAPGFLHEDITGYSVPISTINWEEIYTSIRL